MELYYCKCKFDTFVFFFFLVFVSNFINILILVCREISFFFKNKGIITKLFQHIHFKYFKYGKFCYLNEHNELGLKQYFFLFSNTNLKKRSKNKKPKNRIKPLHVCDFDISNCKVTI